MAGWHNWLDGCESQWTPGVGDGQGGLACCDSWGCKESDMTEWLIWCDLMSPKLWFNRKTCNHFLKPRCISELSWIFLKNTNAQELLFFFSSGGPDMFPMSGHAENQLYYMVIFYLVCFSFSISYSVLPFYLVYVLWFLHLFFMFSQAFIKCSKKGFVYIENLEFLPKLWHFDSTCST